MVDSRWMIRLANGLTPPIVPSRREFFRLDNFFGTKPIESHEPNDDETDQATT